MSSLRSIVYVSSAARPMAEADLELLLVESRRLNVETETTGVLLYGDGNFMQCFEGPDHLISITYERIRASTRHKGIIELANEPITSRSFESWLMGFKRAKDSELLALSSAHWQQHAGGAAGSESTGMYLLKLFWREARH